MTTSFAKAGKKDRTMTLTSLLAQHLTQASEHAHTLLAQMHGYGFKPSHIGVGRGLLPPDAVSTAKRHTAPRDHVRVLHGFGAPSTAHKTMAYARAKPAIEAAVLAGFRPVLDTLFDAIPMVQGPEGACTFTLIPSTLAWRGTFPVYRINIQINQCWVALGPNAMSDAAPQALARFMERIAGYAPATTHYTAGHERVSAASKREAALLLHESNPGVWPEPPDLSMLTIVPTP